MYNELMSDMYLCHTHTLPTVYIKQVYNFKECV